MVTGQLSSKQQFENPGPFCPLTWTSKVTAALRQASRMGKTATRSLWHTLSQLMFHWPAPGDSLPPQGGWDGDLPAPEEEEGLVMNQSVTNGHIPFMEHFELSKTCLSCRPFQWDSIRDEWKRCWEASLTGEPAQMPACRSVFSGALVGSFVSPSRF